MSPHEPRSSAWIRLFMKLNKAKLLNSYLKMAGLMQNVGSQLSILGNDEKGNG